MGSSFFSNPTDYEVVQEGGEGSSFYDGPAYTEIDPVAINNSVAEAAASAAAADGFSQASSASATASATSAAAALVSEGNADTSEAAAAASATAADASEAEATAQAAIATTKASEAATSAAAALVSEGNASASASAASTSAAAALVSEGNADTSETNAAASASAAATSASNAATSEANAATAVQAAAGTATPIVDGVAAVGAGTKWAREDHVHPTDTSRADAAATTAALALKAPLASPALTGTPTAPTASATDDSTTIATTAHVKANFGAWTDYTPSVSAGSGTFTSASATGRYRQVGKTVFFNLIVTITDNGTAAAYVSTTLPVACKSKFIFFGREDAVTGSVFQSKSVAASTSVNMFTFSNAYPGGTGYQLAISGSYEAN